VAKAALGLRAHSGWAALVAVAGTRRAIEVVDRRRIELADPAVPGPAQPYHEAEGKPLAKARQIVDRYADRARDQAREAFRAVIGDLRRRGYAVAGFGLLLSSGRPLPDLESILASHALIHAADGELFRDALQDAAEKHRLSSLRVREKELVAKASATLQAAAEELQRTVNAAGKSIGPPWTQDQKLATLVAWLALTTSKRS
jgi:hypothetical protein